MASLENDLLSRKRKFLEIDAFLRLSPFLEQKAEEERGANRVKRLRQSICFGLLFYNLFNLTSIALLPDVLWTSVILRLLVVTPGAILLAFGIGYVSARTRELLILGGTISVTLVPIILLVLSNAPASLYTICELPLLFVFGNLVLQFRFRHAIVFSSVVASFAIMVVLSRTHAEIGIGFAFAVQILVAAVFTLVCNWRVERTRCDYIVHTAKSRMAVLESRRAAERFKDLSLTDTMTGLPNRRALDQKLAALSAEERPIGLLILDVDYFKLYNDHLGHQAGDHCLRAIAHVLANIAQSDDGMVARFGGEEFVIVAPFANKADIERIAHRLLIDVRSLGLSHPSRPDGLEIVTASLGATSRPICPSDTTALFSEADTALYEAKRRGRNRWRRAQNALDQAPERQAAA